MKTMIQFRAASLAVALATCLLGCESAEDFVCGAAVLRGIEVEVRDADTGTPAAEDAQGVITDGLYTESLRLVGWGSGPTPSPLVLGGADERPGTYTVTITKPGYQPWIRTGVQVIEGPCNVQTVRLQAQLERSQ